MEVNGTGNGHAAMVMVVVSDCRKCKCKWKWQDAQCAASYLDFMVLFCLLFHYLIILLLLIYFIILLLIFIFKVMVNYFELCVQRRLRSLYSAQVALHTRTHTHTHAHGGLRTSHITYAMYTPALGTHARMDTHTHARMDTEHTNMACGIHCNHTHYTHPSQIPWKQLRRVSYIRITN